MKGNEIAKEKAYNKYGIRIVLAVIVVVLCLLFGVKDSVFTSIRNNRIENMTESDFTATFLDESTIQLTNNINGNDMEYSWVIKNYIYGSTSNSGSVIAYEEAQSIEIYYEKLESVEFQGVIVYDGVEYTSNTFAIQDDGTVVLVDDTTAIEEEMEEEEWRNISDIVSLAFLCFLLCSVLLYYIVPKKRQWQVLLIASVVFYSLSGIQYIAFILFTAGVSYWVAKVMSSRRVEMEGALLTITERKEKKILKDELQKKNKELLYLALIATLGVMIIIKYTDFTITNLNQFGCNIPLLNFVMPLGLSFYIFMLIAYLLDVYRGKYKAEPEFAKFFLFISFFPHVSQGPIARYNEMAPQLAAERKFDYENFCLAAQRILWGFFIKLVLADRIAILVDGVYSTYETQSWLMIIIASLAYSIQIYADFYSSMEIAIGSAQMFGIHLQENFLRPYFSTTMPEFWRRWHASLGSWFKDYVFYPISISKKLMKLSVDTRKKFGPNVARVLAAIPPIMGVWILTGLWHGASWKFVAWGVFHGILIVLSTALSNDIQALWKKMGIKTESWDYKIFQMVKVFILCTIGRVFFRASSIGVALGIFYNVITFANSGSLLSFGSIDLQKIDYFVLFISIGALFIVSAIQEVKGSVRTEISRSNVWIRWGIWLFLIFMTLCFGIYGPGAASAFIYEAF